MILENDLNKYYKTQQTYLSEYTFFGEYIVRALSDIFNPGKNIKLGKFRFRLVYGWR